VYRYFWLLQIQNFSFLSNVISSLFIVLLLFVLERTIKQQKGYPKATFGINVGLNETLRKIVELMTARPIVTTGHYSRSGWYHEASNRIKH